MRSFGNDRRGRRLDRDRTAAEDVRTEVGIARSARGSLILALDARHAGQLVSEQVLEELQHQMPEVASLGFRAVWLVGSTPAGTRRLD